MGAWLLIATLLSFMVIFCAGFILGQDFERDKWRNKK
jgi:hypothetical protein